MANQFLRDLAAGVYSPEEVEFFKAINENPQQWQNYLAGQEAPAFDWEAMNQQYSTALADPNWDTIRQGAQFDYRGNAPLQHTDLAGDSRTTPYGAATPNEEFIAWYNPHGGGSFIGVRPDGSKQVINREQAIALGYQPPPVSTDFYNDGLPPRGSQGSPRPPGLPPVGGGTPGGGGGGGGGAEPNPELPGPPPGGGPSTDRPYVPGDSVDTSWDWSMFRPSPGDRGIWGGFDPFYGAFEKYVPGEDSPWGNPNYEGGNRAFYQQQMANLLRDEQGFRQAQRDAGLARQAALDDPFVVPAQEEMWSWTDLPQVQMGTGEPSLVRTGEYQLNPNRALNEGMTGRQVFQSISPMLSDREKVFANKHLDYFDQLDLSQGRQGVSDWLSGNPYRNDKGWTATLGRIADSIYTPIYESAGPTAPIGYAAPVNLGG